MVAPPRWTYGEDWLRKEHPASLMTAAGSYLIWATSVASSAVSRESSIACIAQVHALFLSPRLPLQRQDKTTMVTGTGHQR